MNTRQHIEELFSGYEETAALADFKEEMESNLNDRIAVLKKKGLDEQTAFSKAITELGDVSALADDLSLKRRQEVFSDMYMKTRSYIRSGRMALYVLCGAVIGFGLVVGAVAWTYSGAAHSFLGTVSVFCGAGVLGFVFLGLTQETAAREAMPWKRALWYVLSSGAALFGVFASAVTYFTDSVGLPEALATLIPFFLPGLALGVFLALTEKDRSKPWVVEFRKKAVEREMERFAGPAQQERFGLICGALWIAAVAVFVLLVLLVGIKFSWLAFVAALIAQMLVLSAFTKESGEK
ncbi:MAG: permease prefix domain 1-containing protein [Clostridiales Family XIII bacterium]|jgi:hypothetical protein|nr:permease prefix domain 1-containing protein [Clostridiales Family XIII bacterium]